MNISKVNVQAYIDFSPEVAHALQAKLPIVALESTIIATNLNHPTNVERALHAQALVREQGGVPATIGVVEGRIKMGLSDADIDRFGRFGAPKMSTRDIAATVALRKDGATTVASTLWLAKQVGIQVFATGGIGGVHYGGERSMDVSADLSELASAPLCVVCSGPKAVLDPQRTLEVLETLGVPVVGYRTDTLPGFYTRSTGLDVDQRIDDLADVAAMLKAQRALKLSQAILVCNPVPQAYAMDQTLVHTSIQEALAQAEAKGIQGKDLTPYLLGVIHELTQGQNRVTNRELIYDNVRVAAQLAAHISA
jgi:pseudouridine-5'-phosphate glycosidase